MTAAPDSPLATLWCPSPNREPRQGVSAPDMLILHYTGMELAEAALDWLTREEAKVSCHYLVDEEGRIAQIVAESERAWHAGQSLWAGETDLNSRSIGIEIHNPGHDFDYPEFPEAEMQAVEALCLDILTRHAIAPDRVLAHSDVAPGPKRDPGEKFDWARLAQKGIGLWVEPVPLGTDQGLGPGDEGEAIAGSSEIARLRLWRRGHLDLRHWAREGRRGFPAPFPARAHRRPRRYFDPRDASAAACRAERQRQPSW